MLKVSFRPTPPVSPVDELIHDTEELILKVRQQAQEVRTAFALPMPEEAPQEFIHNLECNKLWKSFS